MDSYCYKPNEMTTMTKAFRKTERFDGCTLQSRTLGQVRRSSWNDSDLPPIPNHSPADEQIGQSCWLMLWLQKRLGGLYKNTEARGSFYIINNLFRKNFWDSSFKFSSQNRFCQKFVLDCWFHGASIVPALDLGFLWLCGGTCSLRSR